MQSSTASGGVGTPLSQQQNSQSDLVLPGGNSSSNVRAQADLFFFAYNVWHYTEAGVAGD